MYALGIHIEGEALKVSLVSKIKNKIRIEFTRSLNVKQFDILIAELQGKDVIFVTGLEPTAMVRRQTSLKLKSKRALLKALPFQVETHIPYPVDEVILAPLLYLNEQILFATTQTLLQNHLQHYQQFGIDPDVVSATGVGLARWGEWKDPETKNQCLMQNGCCVLISDGKISALQAYDNVERMKAFALSKCPAATTHLVEDAYAIPIGLALDALSNHGLQLIPTHSISAKTRMRRNKWIAKYAAACALLTLCIIGIGFYKTHTFEKRLTRQLNTILEPTPLSLSERVTSWENSILSEKKSFPLMPTVPSVADLLSWISSKKQDIDIIHLHYTLVKYPKLGESVEPYQAKVELEFNAPTPTIAREFHESLLKTDPLVNTKQEISWNVSQNHYKVSFYLRAK